MGGAPATAVMLIMASMLLSSAIAADPITLTTATSIAAEPFPVTTPLTIATSTRCTPTGRATPAAAALLGVGLLHLRALVGGWITD
eukprot:1158435-Pelagomonas_calceolata.AAC.5